MYRILSFVAAALLATTAQADTVTITPAAVSDIVVTVSSGGTDSMTCVFASSADGSVPAGCNYAMVTSGGKSASLRPVDNKAGQELCTMTCYGN